MNFIMQQNFSDNKYKMPSCDWSLWKFSDEPFASVLVFFKIHQVSFVYRELQLVHAERDFWAAGVCGEHDERAC